MRLRNPLCAAIGAKEGESIGRHLAKAQVDGQDRIRLREDAFGIGGHANARLTDKKRICIVKKIVIAKTRDHRNVQLMRTGLQCAAILSVPSAATGQDHGALSAL